MNNQGWSIVTGKLPEGLELDKKTGVIFGTPEEFGCFELRVSLCNECGYDEEDIRVEICGPPTITGDETFHFVMGQEDEVQLEFEGTQLDDKCWPDPEPEKYLLTFNISDDTSNPVSYGDIELKDSENNIIPLKNNGDGTHEVELIDGTYTYTITISGYLTETGTVIINGNNENVNIVLTPFEAIIHVIDSSDGTFIIPTRGWGGSIQQIGYDWVIDGSLDGTNYTFIQNAFGSSNYNGGITLSIPPNLQSTNMFLRIKPRYIVYGWARAFGFGDDNLSGASISTNKIKIKSADISSCQKGFRLNGTNSLGDYFLCYIWRGCTSLQTVALMDTTNWNITSIGNSFLGATWRECSSLVTAEVPNMTNWNITSINGGFLGSTWYGCSSLINAKVPDTSNWGVTSIGSSFLNSTWYGCSSLINAKVPDTSNWDVTSIGGYFLYGTWNSCSSLVTAEVPNTTNWNITSINEDFLGYTWNDCSSLINAKVPDTSNWGVTSINRISDSRYTNFLINTWANCSSLVTAEVPNTTNWNITIINGCFLNYTWRNCSLLVNAKVPDTSNWGITSIGENFFKDTWNGCTSLETAVVPDTSKWIVTSIGNDFLHRTWQDCTSLQTAIVPDTSNWGVTSIGTILGATWQGSFSIFGTRILTIPDNVSNPVYTDNMSSPLAHSINNSRIDQIKVPFALITAFQNSWTNITPSSKFVAI